MLLQAVAVLDGHNAAGRCDERFASELLDRHGLHRHRARRALKGEKFVREHHVIAVKTIAGHE
jgi:hypothetical protein